MPFTILYDEPHEASWFKALHPNLAGADEVPISIAKNWPIMSGLLGYDRPDIILVDGERPILVVEETVEVPSGHNVGQRFARLAAAAEHNVPCLYFGPYVARKHGGVTAGPRFMNLRLFASLDAMIRVTGTAVTTINWPVDEDCEVRRDPNKDDDVKEYIETLLNLYPENSNAQLSNAILSSPIHKRMLEERAEFLLTVKRHEQYDLPPDSVQLLQRGTFNIEFDTNLEAAGIKADRIVLYNIGMKKIRSDPYAGMAMLYHYLYIAEHGDRALVLWFPEISYKVWQAAAANPRRKDVRLYRHSAEGILFEDQLVGKSDL